MAEANVNPQGTANTPANGTGNTPAQGTPPQEPAWLNALPPEHRDEARKSYLLQSDYTKKTQEFSDRQKQWDTERGDLQKRVDEYNQFAAQYQPFYQRLQQHWDKIGPILEGREPQYQAPASHTPQQNYFDNWEELAPQEQAKKLGDFQDSRLQQAMGQLKQEFNQALAMREQYYSNYLNILTDAFERKMRDPSLDMNQFMQRANAIQWGKENPLELAYQSMTGPARQKEIEEAAYKRGLEDAALEAKNSSQSAGALQSQTIPLFRQKPLTREQVTERARQVAVDKGLPW